MIDFDATLADMLAEIEWRPQQHTLALSDIADERVYESPQCYLSFHWEPKESNVVLRLFCLYLRTFPQASFESLFDDLGRPVQHGTGNAIKRAHNYDQEKAILFEHFFTKFGVVVAITDQGNGFDYRQTFFRLQNKEKYFAKYGGGFTRFANCNSKISFEKGGRTLLVQYRLDSSPPAKSDESISAFGDGPPPFEIVDSLSKFPRPLEHLYNLAQCEPELLRSEWKSPAFAKRYICPALPCHYLPDEADLANSAELVSVAKQAVTIRYRAVDGAVDAIFFRKEEQGARTNEILRAAWSGELGAGQPFRVPRPIAYHPDRRLLVTTTIDGIELDTIFDGDVDKLVNACERAARWLLKFHATPFEANVERKAGRDKREKAPSADSAPADKKLPNSDMNEAYAILLQDLVAEHKRRSEAERQLARTIVPIHGKFDPENVLLGDGVTGVINFERAKIGEPESDLAKFSYELWKRIFEETGDWQRAEMAADAFLAEYGAGKPENLARLPSYWGDRILKSLQGHLRTRYNGTNDELDQMVQFHVAQLKFAHQHRGPVEPRVEQCTERNLT